MTGRFIILFFLFYLPTFCNSSKKNTKTNLETKNLPLVFSINYFNSVNTGLKANNEINKILEKKLAELKIYSITEATSEKLYQEQIFGIFNQYLNKNVDLSLHQKEAAKKITSIPALAKKIKLTIFGESQYTDSIQISSELYPNSLEKQRPQKFTVVNNRTIPLVSFISDVVDSCNVRGLF